MIFSLRELFGDIPAIHIVDVGASLLEDYPPYQSMFDGGDCQVIGFEPSTDQYNALVRRATPNARYLPYALGDGGAGLLHICQSPGMTSLLEPDLEMLSHFHGFGEWGRVIRKEPMATRKLDEITEVERVDYLKLDVQGSELAVLRGATEKLKNTLVVHTEVQFVPFYKGQPLFAQIDQVLQEAGFFFHRFTPLISRVFRPFLLDNNIYAGLSQILWSDAVYFKQFHRFNELSSDALLKIARIGHDLYNSFDLAALALGQLDQRNGTDRRARYTRKLTGQVVPSSDSPS